MSETPQREHAWFDTWKGKVAVIVFAAVSWWALFHFTT